MSDALCLLIDPLDTAQADHQAPEHLALAGELVGDPLHFATTLVGVGGSPGVAIAAASDADALDRLAAESPLQTGRRLLCAVDPTIVPASDDHAAGGYLELVLDPTTPPIPFDDPTVVGIFHDYLAWYLPMLGPRYLHCQSLWHDGVRVAGAFTAFSAADDDQAGWCAQADPWRRVAPGYLVRLPEGVLHTQPPPPGPGTQRSGHFSCGRTHSIAEPGVDRRETS